MKGECTNVQTSFCRWFAVGGRNALASVGALLHEDRVPAVKYLETNLVNAATGSSRQGEVVSTNNPKIRSVVDL
jgi:hypothetical protein